MTVEASGAGNRAPALYIAAGLVAFLVYANSLGNGFAFDDIPAIVDDAALRSWESLLRRIADPYWPISSVEQAGLWRPVTTFGYGVLWLVGGGSPFPFHLANVLLHVGTTLLVLDLGRRLLGDPAGLVAGLLFAVHPVHVEAVANGVGLAELLASASVVGACALFVARRDRLEGWPAATITGLFAVGFLSKEVGAVLPALLFLLDAYMTRAQVGELPAILRRRAHLYGSLAVVGVALLGARYLVIGTVADPAPPLAADVLAEIPRIWTVAAVWPEYLRLLAYPAHLSADYAPAVIPVRWSWDAAAVAGVVLALGVLILAWVLWRRGSTPAAERRGEGVAALGVLWFAIAILPVSNLLFLSGVLLAERTLYLPSVGFVLVAGWGIARLATGAAQGARHPRIAALVLALVPLGWMAYGTWERNPTWKDSETVFNTLIRDHPESARSQWLLAGSLVQEGREEEGRRVFLRAYGLIGWPGRYVFLIEGAHALMNVGDTTHAAWFLRSATEVAPDEARPHRLLAVIAQDRGEWAAAVRHARAALERGMEDEIVHHLIATGLVELGQPAEAIPYRVRALQLAAGSTYPHWIWLARAQRAAGREGAACRSLAEAERAAEGEEARESVDSLRLEWGLAGCTGVAPGSLGSGGAVGPRLSGAPSGPLAK